MGLGVEDQEDDFFVVVVVSSSVAVAGVVISGSVAGGGRVFGVATFEGFGGVASRPVMGGIGISG